MISSLVNLPSVTLGRVESVANTIEIKQTTNNKEVGMINMGKSRNLGTREETTMEIIIALILSMMFALLSAIELRLMCVR